MRRRWFIHILLVTAALLPAASAQAQMRVATYNCAALNGNLVAFQNVIDALMIDDKPGFATAPWVVVFQEVPSSIVGNLLFRLNAAAPPGVTYAQATYTSSIGEDNSAGAIALFYRQEKLNEVAAAHADIPTGGNRNTDRWLLTLDQYTAPQVSFYVYGSHLKANNNPPDVAERNAGAQAIRANANSLPAGAKIIYLGDYNIYVNTEPAYQTMIAPGNGRAVDALGNGSWAGMSNAIKHTQSPCISGCDLVGGGLDDRFDFIFYTDALNNATGLGRIIGTYRAFGNDGQHYDTNINQGNNFYYPDDLPRSNDLADALYAGSDHLPVILDFRLPAIASAQLAPNIGTVIEGAVVTHPLTIANVVDATVGVAADVLNYTAFGTGGLSGGGSGNVGVPPDLDVLNLTLDTSTPGNIACGALVISTGQDVQNPEIILNASATVLRHAAGSFSSKSLLDATTVSMRFDANTGVQSIDVPVYNFGFDALQALLDLDEISAATAPFSFVGGLEFGIDDVPAMLSFDFDTTGLAPGTYTNAFTIDSSDEDLPGEALAQLTLELEVIINEDKAPPCPADMVNSKTFQPPPDGIVDGADLAFLLGEWGIHPGSPADLVDSTTFEPPPDGVVDGADLAVLLGAWGACD